MGPGMAALLRNCYNFKKSHGLLPKSSNTLLFRLSTRAFASAKPPSSLFAALDTFPERHIGPDDHEASHMLSTLGYDSMDAFVDAAVPSKIRVSTTAVSKESIPAFSESELYYRAKQLGSYNKPFKSYIGMGYHNAVVPPVILRNASLSLAFQTFLKLSHRLWKTLLGIPHTPHISPKLLKVLQLSLLVASILICHTCRTTGVPRQLSVNGHVFDIHGRCKRFSLG